VIVAVVHDEFRGIGLSGVSGFLGAGAVVVDVRGVSDGDGACREQEITKYLRYNVKGVLYG